MMTHEECLNTHSAIRNLESAKRAIVKILDPQDDDSFAEDLLTLESIAKRLSSYQPSK